MKKDRSTEYEKMRRKALEQIRTGQSLTGKGGAFAPLLKELLDEALEAEMDVHLDDAQRHAGNKRNGRKTKKIRTSAGEVELSTPQDRQSTFDPQIVKKRERILANSLEDMIIGLYSLGMSYRDISAHIKERFDMRISKSTLTEITDRIVDKARNWRNRPLESIYVVVYLDAMFYKARIEGRVEQRAVYNLMGINRSGYKDILGMYTAETESANFWLSVMTDLHNRGVEDILIACTDNLAGFGEAIHSVFPKAEVQLCIVHQIRNSLKYVTTKDKREFAADLKSVYRAATLQGAAKALDELEAKWGGKYPKVIESWRRNWDELTAYFQYTAPIRKLIYTTNAVEGYHRQLRKVTKSKGAFTSEEALLKLLYLAQRRISNKWNSPLHNWALTAQQLAIRFADRFPLDLA